MISIRLIQQATCEHYGVAHSELVSGCQGSDVVRPRHVAMTLAKRLTRHPKAMIGRQFGDRDPASVRYALRKIEVGIAEDPALAEDVEAIEIAVRATAAILDRRRQPLHDIDGVGIAEAVLQGRLAAASLSVDEIKAMALAAVAAGVEREEACDGGSGQ